MKKWLLLPILLPCAVATFARAQSRTPAITGAGAVGGTSTVTFPYTAGTNRKINASKQSGRDFCAKVSKAVAKAQSGDTIDLSGFTSPQTCSATLTINESVRIVNGNVRVTCTMSDPGLFSGCVDISADHVSISGTRNFVITQGDAANIENAVWIGTQNHLRFSGFKIDWNDAKQTNTKGFYTCIRSGNGPGSGTDVTVDGMEFTRGGNRAIDFRGISHAWVQNSYFHQTGIGVAGSATSGGNAISIDVDGPAQSSDAWVVNNVFEEWGDSAVGAPDSIRIHIVGNTIRGRLYYGHEPLAVEAGIGLDGSSDSDAIGNHVIDVTGASVFDAQNAKVDSACYVAHNVRVVGNEFVMVPSSSHDSVVTVLAYQCSGTPSKIFFVGNTFHETRMIVSGTTDLTITGNQFENVTAAGGVPMGIAMYAGTYGEMKNFNISGNTFSQTDGSLLYGLYVDAGVTRPGAAIFGPNQFGPGVTPAVGALAGISVISTADGSSAVPEAETRGASK